jgi:hypothetical protein
MIGFDVVTSSYTLSEILFFFFKKPFAFFSDSFFFYWCKFNRSSTAFISVWDAPSEEDGDYFYWAYYIISSIFKESAGISPYYIIYNIY